MDALLPAEMAEKAESVGVRKVALPALQMFALAVLAGAFIALGAVFATTVVAGSTLPFGVNRLLAGTVFSLGLILVIVGGAELFTGNALVSMAWASGKVKTGPLLRSWAIVYTGNLVGAVGTAALVVVGGQYASGGGAVGRAALAIASAKLELGFVQAIALGVLCNALVCLAVWLTFSARSAADKVAVIVPPIAAFVAAGFEHSIANMYFVPVAMMIDAFAPASFWATGAEPTGITIGAFLVSNLLPVTLGNILGGVGLVGLVYWAIYLRRRPVEA